MDTSLELHATKMQNYLKVGGAVVVAGAASLAIIAIGASVASASLVALVALVLVNYVVPVSARTITLWRVKTLTKLTEVFSEETIRKDETEEGERIKVQEQQYVTIRAELEGAQEDIQNELQHATPEEISVLQAQIDAIQATINTAEAALKQKKVDFEELLRVNKQYISFHRAERAMSKAKGAERSTDQLQQIETARNAIKTRMRAALAGKTIDSMNMALRKPQQNPGVVLNVPSRS